MVYTCEHVTRMWNSNSNMIYMVFVREVAPVATTLCC